MVLPPIRSNIYNDLRAFAIPHIESMDIDPMYPVLRHFYALQDWQEETALWFTMLYLAYYHVGSAARAFQHYPSPPKTQDDFASIAFLPTATERRGLRGGKVVQHLQSYVGQVIAAGSQRALLRRDECDTTTPTDSVGNYLAFWDSYQTIWGNGRWATFKAAEVLQQVHGWPLTAPDMRLQYCSGPKAGLRRVFGMSDGSSVALLDQCAMVLRSRLHEDGVVLSWETLETVLCDFNSLCNGHYYVGHDIDQMMEQLETVHADARDLVDALYAARSATIPHAYLGEYHNWDSVCKERRTLYATTRKIAVRS